jgi:hypothetical protein
MVFQSNAGSSRFTHLQHHRRTRNLRGGIGILGATLAAWSVTGCADRLSSPTQAAPSAQILTQVVPSVRPKTFSAAADGG